MRAAADEAAHRAIEHTQHARQRVCVDLLPDACQSAAMACTSSRNGIPA